VIVLVEPAGAESPAADTRRAASRGLDGWLAGGDDGVKAVLPGDALAPAAEARLLLREPESAVPTGALRRAVDALLGSGADAVVPAGFYAGAPSAPEPYVTLWELDELAGSSAGGVLEPVSAPAPVELRRMVGNGAAPVAASGFFAHSFAGRRAHPRSDVAALVPQRARRVLDVGCADGVLGEILEERGADVLGIEPDRLAAAGAARRIARVLPLPLEAALEELRGERFDAIVMADVLEHLSRPLEALRQLAARAAPDAVLVLSLPNASHAAVLAGALMGRWDPALEGIVADDHRTYAGRPGWERVLRTGGWAPDSWRPVPSLRARLVPWLEPLAAMGLELEDLTAVQWLVTARLAPRSGSVVLDDAEADDPLDGVRERLARDGAFSAVLPNAVSAAALAPLLRGDVVEQPARQALIGAVTARGMARRFAGSDVRVELAAAESASPGPALEAVIAAARAEGLPVDDAALATVSYQVRFSPC